MTCVEFRNALSAWRDEPASPAARAAEVHREACPACARLAQALVAGVTALRRHRILPSRPLWPSATPPPDPAA